jgi:glycosyltransferase involved in cell wall biosynthesis
MVSIVTGTLNRINLLPNLIKNTVDSNELLELVLVDGGSSDGTIEYIKNLSHPRIKLIEVGGRSPYSHFMNLGIRNATHDWICQWNDDVILTNSWDEIIDNISIEYDFYIFNWKYGNIDDLNNQNWLNGIDQKDGWCLTDNTVNKKFDIGGEIVVNYGIYNKKIFKEIGLYSNQFLYYFCDGDMAHRAHYFGYKHLSMPNIKVCSINTNKQAFINSIDEQKTYINNIHLYMNKQLPNTGIEFL